MLEELKEQVTQVVRVQEEGTLPLCPAKVGVLGGEALQQPSSLNRVGSVSPSTHGSGLSLCAVPSGTSTSLVCRRTLSSEHTSHRRPQGSCDNSDDPADQAYPHKGRE